MRKQYDTIVSQYEKTNESLARELDVATREIERLNAKMKESQTKNSSHSLNSNTNSNNKGSVESLESYAHSNREFNEAIEKYENKIALLSQ